MAETRTQEQGAALILVLLVVAILVVLTVQFSFSTKVDVKTAQYHTQELQNYYALRSGITLAQEILKTDRDNSTIDHLDEDWAKPSSEWLSEDVMNAFLPQIDAVRYAVSIQDEHGKFDLNQLVDDQNPSPAIFKEVVKAYKPMEEDLEKAIADFISHFERPLYSTFELKGMDAKYHEDLYGKERERDAVFSESEEEPRPGFLEYVTVWTGGRVNVNTAGKGVLMSLHKSITSKIADNILQRRKNDPYENKSELQQVQGITKEIYGAIEDHIVVQSNTFLVTIEMEKQIQPEPAKPHTMIGRAVLKMDPTGTPRLIFWDVAS